MAVPLTDLDAWEALQPFQAELDRVRRARELKEAMWDVITKKWDITNSHVSLIDFGVIWIDSIYRRLCNKFAKMGPGRETFDIGVYRTLKSSRLDGYWDVLLEDLADWVELFAKDSRTSVTLDDYERLIRCMPPDRNLNIYRQNVRNLFWPKPGQRMPGFLTRFTPAAYEDAFNAVSTIPPSEEWNLRLIMNQIRDKALACKSAMLHVDLWFDPELEEPANRTNFKAPMYNHLKPAFSKYAPSDRMYEQDESWKPQALGLQRVVLNYTVHNWVKSNHIIGNLGNIRAMSAAKYSEYLLTEFWIKLLHEVRGYTSVPFRHPSLVGFKRVEDLPPWVNGPPQPHKESELGEFRSRAGNAVREEYDDGQTPDSNGSKEALESVDESSSGSQHGRDDTFFMAVNSPPQEALTVESEDEGDIIHVRTPSPAQEYPSKKRKVPYISDDLGYTPIYDDQNAVLQNLPRKLIKLKYPHNDSASKKPHRITERPHNPALKGLANHPSPNPQTFQESAPATLAVLQTPRTTPMAVNTVKVMGTQGENPPLASIEKPRNVERVKNSENSIQQPSCGTPKPLQEEAARAWVRPNREQLDISLFPSGEVHRDIDRARWALAESERITESSDSRARESEEHLSNLDNQAFNARRNHSLNHSLSHPSSRTSTPNNNNNAQSPLPASQSLPRRDSFSLLAETPIINNNNNNSSSSSSKVNANKNGACVASSTKTPTLPAHFLSMNKTEQAILALQDEFDEHLNIHEMLAAIKLLRNDFEAGIFLTLKPGSLRNAWLWDSIKDLGHV